MNALSPFRTRTWLSTGVLFVMAVAIALVWASRRETKTGKLIQQKLAELRAAGEPITADDLARRFPDPPPEEDAGLIYANAFAIATNNLQRPRLPLVDVAIANSVAVEPSALNSAVAFCQNSAALTNVIPNNLPVHTRFPSHWQLGFTNGTRVNFLSVRLLAQTIAAQIVVAAEVGDTEAATQWIEAGFRFSRAIQRESWLVQHMIRSAVDGLFCGCVERALTRAKFTDQQLQRIAASVPPDDPEALRECFRVERCMVIWVFDSARRGMREEELFRSRSTAWWERWWDRIRYGPFYNEADHLGCLLLNPAELKSLRDPASAQREMNEMGIQFQRSANGRLAQMVIPNFQKAITAQFDNRARILTMKAALEVERHRLAHDGALPTSPLPPDLVPNQSLKLKPLPAGFMVYSAGSDGIDNGGITRTNSNTQTNYDITFSIER